MSKRLAVVIVMVFLPVGSVGGQPTTTAAAEESIQKGGRLESLAINTAPTTEEGLQELLKLVRAHLARWRDSATTQPTTQPAQPAGPAPTAGPDEKKKEKESKESAKDGSNAAAKEKGPAEPPGQPLWTALLALEGEVLQQLDDIKQVAELKKPQRQEELTRQVQALSEEGLGKKKKWEGLIPAKDASDAERQEKTKQLLVLLKSEGLAGRALEKALKQAEEDYNSANNRIESRASIQKHHVEELSGLSEKVKNAPQAIQEARRALEGYSRALAESKEKPSGGKEAEDAMLALLEARCGLTVLRAGGYGLRQTRLELERTYEEQLIKGLREKVEGLRLERLVYQHAKAGMELEEVQAQQRKQLPAFEKAYLEAKKLELESRQWFSQFEGLTKDRFSKTRLDNLQSRVKLERGYWAYFLDTLDTRRGLEIREAYQKVRGDIEAESANVSGLRAKLTEAYRERSATLRRRNEVTNEFEKLSQQFETEIAKAEDQEAATRTRTQWAELKPLFDTKSEMRRIVESQDEIIGYLQEALKVNKGYLTELDQTRSQLFWSYLRVRDRGVFTPDWVELKKEWAKAFAWETSPFPGLLKSFPEQVGRSRPGMRAWTVVFLVVSLLAGVFVQRRLLAWADAREKRVYAEVREDQLTGLPLSDRLQVQGVRVVSRASVVAFLLAAGLGGCLFLGLEGTARRTALTLLGFLLVLRVGFAVVRGLFHPARPRFRLMQCTNEVASYWWNWWRLALFLSLIVMPVPLVLRSMNVLPLTEEYLWDVVLALYLVCLIGFLRRRESVLHVTGPGRRADRGLFFGLISTLYPVLFLLSVLLLILAVAGYSALATHVFRGMLWTVFALIATTLLTRSLGDMIDKYRRRLSKRVEAAMPEAQEGDEPDREAALEQAREFDLTLAFVSSLGKWVLRVASLMVILAVWGVSVVEIDAFLDYRLAGDEKYPVTMWRVLALVVVLVGSVLVSRGLRWFLRARVYPNYEGLDTGAQAAVNTVIHYVLLGLGLFVGLQVVHVHLATLTVLFGTVGLGLGLGLQPLFVNFLSGLIILFERHLKVGDKVEVDGILGKVTGISMRATSIITFDNVDMVIPNADFITSKVTNWTLNEELIRGTVDVGVAYGSDPKLVKRLLLQVAHESLLVLADPPPQVRFMNFGASSLDFRVYAWFANMGDRWDFITDSRYRIVELFKEHGIEIPFPQQTLSTVGDRPLKVSIENPRKDEPDQGEKTQ